MKTILLFFAKRHSAKNLLKAVLVVYISIFHFSYNLPAQCPSGYTSAQVNWDNLDFLHNSAFWYNTTSPSTGQMFVTNAMKQSQSFAIGTNSLTIATTIPVGSSGSLWGDVTSHTGETGAYGTGADIAFVKTGIGASTITLTFLNEVKNVKFSLFDIDQEITFAPTATNASGVAQSITLTKPSLTSLIPLNGNSLATTISGTAPLANWATGGGTGTNYANTSSDGTVNVDIAGPVKTIILTFSNDGNSNDFWLSDITACIADPGFTTNYYQTYTQPYTGQPAYFLANVDSNLNVYMVDPVNATADVVFTDPGTALGSAPAGVAMNSLAYDPVNHWLYYVMNGSAMKPGNRSVKKYDFTTGTISTVISDINTLGIPTFIQGIEAAAAAFYDGSLYLGVEGTDATSFSTNTESIIWRIDFDGAGNAIRASQVFGLPSDNSGQPSHDWGDFITRDGTLVTHASNWITPYQSTFVHYNMQTGQTINTYSGYIDTAGQLGQIYNGTVYRLDNRIALYNENGTTGSVSTINVTSCSPAWNNRSANDASDPFRPAQDFGDAPSSYDAVALSPAANQKACNNSTLRIGSSWDREWSKGTSSDASGDGSDEDGITTVTAMISDGNPYNHVQDVIVLNNTGAIAYLAGWLDYNANGTFDASEGVVVTVPSSASPQTITLGWTGITVAPGTPNTFLRVRLYSGTLTTSNATGWLSDGETEDYPVISMFMPLMIQLLDFDATLTKDKNVLLTWKASADNNALGFEVEKSNDHDKWEKVGWVDIKTSSFTSDYSLLDQEPFEGRSYYRLKMVEKSGSSRYSNIKLIQIDRLVRNMKLYPNPAKNSVIISLISDKSQPATLQIRSIAGQLVFKKSLSLETSENKIPVDITTIPNGLYVVELAISEKTYINKLTIAH
jgi:hypothetical protein